MQPSMILQNHMPAAHFCDKLRVSDMKEADILDEEGFVKFLEIQGLSTNGINTRKSRAKDVVDIIGKDLDIIVADDETMYQAILELQKVDNPAHTPRQNALRKYYTFRNSKEFPRISEYEKTRK